jgi:protein involved in temperature-dependent protein secretion
VTEWSEPPAPVRGHGQRLMLLGEEAVALSDLASVTFADAG